MRVHQQSKIIMISQINQSIKQLLKSRLETIIEETDVEFELPSKTWVSGLTRPTVNFFLHDVEEDTKLRNVQITKDPYVDKTPNKSRRTRVPPRAIMLKYQVAVFSMDVRDQNELLWGVLSILMRHAYFPHELLPESIQKLEFAVPTRVIQPDDRSKSGDLWSSLDLPPRPWLWYLVTVPLDLGVRSDDPLILTQRVNFYEGVNAEHWDFGWKSELHRFGGTVRDEHGELLIGVNVWQEGVVNAGVLTDQQGRYELAYTRDGEITLWMARDGESPRRVILRADRQDNDLVFELGPATSVFKKAPT
jgi:Pvc16 N-terminal domain